MGIKDLHSSVRAMCVIAPVAIGANGTKSGKVIDTQGYGGVEFIAAYGAVAATGSTVTLVMKEGDATGSLTSVADADMIGTETLASLAAAATRTSGVSKNVVKRVGYKGTKRYVTIDATTAGTTQTAPFSVEAVLHEAMIQPTANP